MSRGQRIVLVVALGAIAIVVANTVNRLAFEQPGGGWFMYAPNSSVLMSPDFDDDGDTVGAAIVWVVAIGAWLAASWRILRDPPAGRRGRVSGSETGEG